MTKETAGTLSQVFLVLSILCILFVCGNCCANSQKGEYGPEEFYDKGGGEIGYGAKYYNSSTDQSMLVALIGGTLFLAFSIASAGFHAHAEKLPSTLDAREKPKKNEKPRPTIVKNPAPEPPDYSPDYSEGLPGLKDPLFKDALTQIIVDKRAAVVRLQHEFSIGYDRASAILDAMLSEGLIGEMDVKTRSHPVLSKAYERLKDIAVEDENEATYPQIQPGKRKRRL